MGNTITSVYHANDLLSTPRASGPTIAPTLEGQLHGFVASIQIERADFTVNHYSYYIRRTSTDRREIIIISNTDVTDERKAYSNDAVFYNMLECRLKPFTVKDQKINRIGAITSSDPKLDDYKLMEMLGLLPKTTSSVSHILK